MAQNVIDGNLFVRGALGSTTFTAPDGSIDDDAIQAAANVAATKIIHRVPLQYAQAGGTAVVADDQMLHIVRGTAGTIVGVEAAVETVATGADRSLDVDIELSTGGGAFSSVLSAAITIDDEDDALTAYAGTLSSTALVDGDILKVVVTVSGSAGNQAEGLVATVIIDEEPL